VNCKHGFHIPPFGGTGIKSHPHALLIPCHSEEPTRRGTCCSHGRSRFLVVSLRSTPRNESALITDQEHRL